MDLRAFGGWMAASVLQKEALADGLPLNRAQAVSLRIWPTKPSCAGRLCLGAGVSAVSCCRAVAWVSLLGVRRCAGSLGGDGKDEKSQGEQVAQMSGLADMAACGRHSDSPAFVVMHKA